MALTQTNTANTNTPVLDISCFDPLFVVYFDIKIRSIVTKFCNGDIVVFSYDQYTEKDMERIMGNFDHDFTIDEILEKMSWEEKNDYYLFLYHNCENEEPSLSNLDFFRSWQRQECHEDFKYKCRFLKRFKNKLNLFNHNI
jgi:hypothetical protein